MIAFFRDRPWIWIYVAFLVLFGAWTTLFTIAYKNQPEQIPLGQAAEQSQPGTENH
ncbi:MAG: hypothetical protein KDN20_16100 [Verrucomicrobiae bacterium]|nr:hypothetical protein [Verrucomicrobiae bacterium]